VEEKFREICHRYGFDEIRTPTFESTSLFKRGVGETTDIVQKEMFTVISDANLRKYHEGKFDLDKRGFTLKPEGTAPVVRSFVENKLYADAQPTKLFYITPCFRNENPQAGRLREFHQVGIETLSSMNPATDAEIIALAKNYFEELGLRDLTIKINSVGCKSCRPVYHEKLKTFLEPRLDQLCETCQGRFHTNPLRILDCKVPTCQAAVKDAPRLIDHLCEDCRTHFSGLKDALDAFGIPFVVDSRIVRGLDYYTKTAFEIISENIGAQATVCGGGRYDGLVEEVGGPETPGVGFGLGIERLILTLEAEGVAFPDPEPTQVFIVILGEAAKLTGLGILKALRDAGIKSDFDHLERSLKAQMRYADKLSAAYTLILGEEELKSREVTVKHMASSTQESVTIDGIPDYILAHLGGRR
jgi:histidyl-tRNA synthetase